MDTNKKEHNSLCTVRNSIVSIRDIRNRLIRVHRWPIRGKIFIVYLWRAGALRRFFFRLADCGVLFLPLDFLGGASGIANLSSS